VGVRVGVSVRVGWVLWSRADHPEQVITHPALGSIGQSNMIPIPFHGDHFGLHTRRNYRHHRVPGARPIAQVDTLTRRDRPIGSCMGTG